MQAFTHTRARTSDIYGWRTSLDITRSAVDCDSGRPASPPEVRRFDSCNVKLYTATCMAPPRARLAQIFPDTGAHQMPRATPHMPASSFVCLYQSMQILRHPCSGYLWTQCPHHYPLNGPGWYQCPRTAVTLNCHERLQTAKHLQGICFAIHKTCLLRAAGNAVARESLRTASISAARRPHRTRRKALRTRLCSLVRVM